MFWAQKCILILFPSNESLSHFQSFTRYSIFLFFTFLFVLLWLYQFTFAEGLLTNDEWVVEDLRQRVKQGASHTDNHDLFCAVTSDFYLRLNLANCRVQNPVNEFPMCLDCGGTVVHYRTPRTHLFFSNCWFHFINKWLVWRLPYQTTAKCHYLYSSVSIFICLHFNLQILNSCFQNAWWPMWSGW